MDGESACIAATGNFTDPLFVPNAEQVYLLIDNYNNDAHGQKINNDLSLLNNTITINGLTNDTEYCIFCIATDVTVLWPSYMVFSDAYPIPCVSIRTLSTADVEEDQTSYSNTRLTVCLLLFWIF